MEDDGVEVNSSNTNDVPPPILSAMQILSKRKKI